MGAWASGVTHTPQDHIVVKGCNGLTFTHLNLEAIATTSDVSRTYLSFQGPNRAVSLSEIWCSPMASNHPSVAMLEFDPSGGANDEFHLGPATFRWDGSSGGTPLFSGLSTLTKRFDNHGEATIPTGASRKVTVTHGLRRTPQPGEISVTKADTTVGRSGRLRGSDYVRDLVRDGPRRGAAGVLAGECARHLIGGRAARSVSAMRRWE